MGIQKTDIEAIYPANAVQHALLLQNLNQNADDAGFIHVQCRLEGAIEPEGLQLAWNHLLRRHQSLRMGIRIANGSKPMLIVCQNATCSVSFEDLSDQSVPQQRQHIETFCKEDRIRGIDLMGIPGGRVQLMRLGPESHSLIWTCHHTFLDGWSSGIVLNEVIEAARALKTGRAIELPAPPLQRRYFEWLAARDRTAAKSYWQQRLQGCTQPTEISNVSLQKSDIPQHVEFQQTETIVPEETVQALIDSARKHQVTSGVVAMTAWSILLASVSGQQTVTFGTVVSGRPADLPGSMSMVGMFANAIPVSVRIDETESIDSLLSSVKRTLDDSIEHQHLSIAEIQQECSRIPGRFRMFESLFVFENFSMGSDNIGETDLRMVDYHSGLTSNYPLTLSIVPGDTWKVVCRFDGSRFATAEVEEHLADFQRILQQITGETSTSVATVSTPHRSSLNNTQAPQDFNATTETKTAIPHSPLEQQLTSIWSEVLGTNNFSRDDNFFHLGGTSMTMIQLVARGQQSGLVVTPASLYEHPTIASLAREIQSNDASDTPATTVAGTPVQSDEIDTSTNEVSEDFHRLVNGETIRGPIRLSVFDDKPILFLVPPHGNKVNQFWELAKNITEFTCYSPFTLQEHVVEELTVPDLVSLFLEQIRSVQPQGPYRITGYCDGAFVAWEIAQLLSELGEEVRFLGNIDTPNPDSVKVVPEPFTKKLRRRIKTIGAKSLIQFCVRFASVSFDWASRRIRRSISGERHLIHGGSRLAWLYRPKRYNGRATLFRLPPMTGTAMVTDATYGWGELATQGLDVVTVYGSRFEREDYFLSDDNARDIARQIQAAIQSQDVSAKRRP